MVNRKHGTRGIDGPSIVVEQLCHARTGVPEDNEDRVFVGSDFIAVVDGTTSKSKRRWRGRTGGKVAAELVIGTFGSLPARATVSETVAALTSTFRQFHEKHGLRRELKRNPHERLSASFAAFSVGRREIWIVGDCQCLVDGVRFAPRGSVERVLTEVRSLYIETELRSGRTVEDLLRDDTGRGFIQPLLKRQALFQNVEDAGGYGYAVIDGFPVLPGGIFRHKIPPSTREIVLATDGYPELRRTLAKSEAALRALLARDPLLVHEYKATKGMTRGSESFDDRAFVRCRLR